MVSLRGWRKLSVRRIGALNGKIRSVGCDTEARGRKWLSGVIALSVMLGAGLPLPAWAASPRAHPVPAWAKAAIQQAQITGPPSVIFDEGDIPSFLPQDEFDFDGAGNVGTYMPNSPRGFLTRGNAFFTAKGITANGRSCITCHQPPNGWSVTPVNLQQRFADTNGTDPVFDAVDGMGCPSEASGATTLAGKAAASYLLLNKGCFAFSCHSQRPSHAFRRRRRDASAADHRSLRSRLSTILTDAKTAELMECARLLPRSRSIGGRCPLRISAS